MKNIYLFQPQYASMFHDTESYWIPYSVGSLWAYACQFDDIKRNWSLPEIGFKREAIDQVLDRMKNPSICGFSTYLWNEQYNLQLAKEIKQKWPDCYIFFGGPQVGSDYLDLGYIDSVVMAEGELVFLSLLRAVQNNQPVPELSFKQRIESLGDIPSPYTSGVFDQMVRDNPNYYWNAVLETNRGCPFSCTFCDWGSVTYSKVKRFELDKIKEELDWMANNRVANIHIADANFGIFGDRDLEIAQYIASAHARGPCDFDYVNVTYAKNSNEKIFQIAKEFGNLTKSVTVSMQSMNPTTLVAVKRDNMKINNIVNVMSYGEKYNIPTYTEMILGLPLETLESWKDGIANLLELGQHNSIDVFLAILIKNSEMSSPGDRFKYGLKGIKVKGYISFAGFTETDTDPLAELVELVSSTNTMSLQQLVDSFMFSWIVTHMHLSGYSQIVAKYCRNVQNISYQTFYNRFIEVVTRESTCLSIDFSEMRQAVVELLTTGTISVLPIRANHIFFYSYLPLFLKKDELVELSIRVAESVCALDETIVAVQRKFIYDSEESYPQVVNSEYNIDTWDHTPTTYIIKNRVENFVPSYSSVTLQRRRGYLKNSVTISNEI